MRPVGETDVQTIIDHFSELEDPRSHVNRKHLLGDLIVISICAVIAGADGPEAIAEWAKANKRWLRQRLPLPCGIPSHDTIGRVLATLKPQAFQACFQAWIRSLCSEGSDDDAATDAAAIVAIDGKTLRRSHDRKRELGPMHMVSAWSVTHGVSLGQLATEEKSNEITAIPQLIDNLDVQGATVTIDAAGCQKQIASKIVDQGGDYVLALKGNQETLHQAVEDWMVEQTDNDFADVEARKHEEIVKGHGRVDKLIYYHFKAPDHLPGKRQWKRLRTVGIALRISKQGERETSDIRHFISSLPLGVKQFARAVRGHWAIENTLHWSLDVTFREDESRLRNRRSADNLAWLKRFGLSLLKRHRDKKSVAMRRRWAGWQPAYLAEILGIPPI
jgi:predicted transposase YbfD/YdcC